MEVEGLKCVKFESELCPKIKQFIGYQEIFKFSVLVNKCRIYNEDSRGRSAQYKMLVWRRAGTRTVVNLMGLQLIRKNISFNKILQVGKKQVREALMLLWDASNVERWVICANECKNSGQKCFKYGKIWHFIAECKSIVLTCYTVVNWVISVLSAKIQRKLKCITVTYQVIYYIKGWHTFERK